MTAWSSHSAFETGVVLIGCTFMVMFALLVIMLCSMYVVVILASVRVVIIGDLHVLWCTTNEFELRMHSFFLDILKCMT